MNITELLVLFDGALMGRITRHAHSRLRFAYEASWREHADAVPLSLSMPLTLSEHPHGPVEAFLWGLLPDSERVLDRWARRTRRSPSWAGTQRERVSLWPSWTAWSKRFGLMQRGARGCLREPAVDEEVRRVRKGTTCLRQVRK